jgi:ribonuclease P protein component
MKRQQRLTRSSDFGRVRKHGRSWAHPLLILAADRNDLHIARFGFVVSRKVGKAVVRNRVKRRLREAVRQHLDEIPSGWDLVILARPPSAGASFAEIESALAQTLARATSWFNAQAAVEQGSTGVGA